MPQSSKVAGDKKSIQRTANVRIESTNKWNGDAHSINFPMFQKEFIPLVRSCKGHSVMFGSQDALSQSPYHWQTRCFPYLETNSNPFAKEPKRNFRRQRLRIITEKDLPLDSKPIPGWNWSLSASSLFTSSLFTWTARLLGWKLDAGPFPHAASLGTEPETHCCHLCFHLVNKDQKWLLL